MNLSRKLPLAFTLASLLVAGAGSVGLYRLNASLSQFQRVMDRDYENERAVGAMLFEFKTQVQEWKDTLLRGKDPQQLDKYWSAFGNHERNVDEAAARLLAALPQGQPHDLVAQFAQAHGRMGEAYRKGFELFKAAGMESAAGDAAVKGQDRAPAELLNKAKEAITATSKAEMEEAREANRTATATSVALMLLGLGGAVLGGVLLSRSITRPLGDAVEVAQRVAAGELAVDVQVRTRDETGQLLAALGRMTGNLTTMVERIRASSEVFATGAGEIAQGTTALSMRTEHQASTLEETASSMEQLTASVKNNTNSAAQADNLVRAAAQVATKGGEVVAEVVGTMQAIHSDAAKMSEIVSLIDGIAFQTNILALNAAVEAARAGEQGRGFAVVASEVRALAQRSAAAAKDIKVLIAGSVERVDQGRNLASRAGSTMSEVVSSVEQVTALMAEMLAACREQDVGIEQVNQAVVQMDQATQQIAALMEEAAAAAQSMNEQAGSLLQSVSAFRVSDNTTPQLGTGRRLALHN